MFYSLITLIVIFVAIMIILDQLSIINVTKKEGFMSKTYPENSFEITNKMNEYRTSVDPWDNNFYSNTDGFINPMDKYMYGPEYATKK